MQIGKINIPTTELKAFCRKWKVRELAVFGSALREDFGPQSDIDVLVSFEPETFWGFEVSDMEAELETMLGRKVDLVMKDGLRNPFRRHAILSTRQVVYAT